MSWTLITGGAKGLGAELSIYLAKQGYHPLIHYNTHGKEAEEIAEQCRSYGVKAKCIHGDFSTRDSTQLFIQHCLNLYPDVSNLINNVGNIVFGSPLESSIEEWHSLFQPNLHAPFELTQAYAESIKKAKGSIINLGTSGIDAFKLSTFASAYMITKTGLWVLTRGLAKEFAPFNVNVNMVSPGVMENSVVLPDEMHLPMGRMGTLEEVSRTIAYLIAPENHYITGQNIEVAGGTGL